MWSNKSLPSTCESLTECKLWSMVHKYLHARNKNTTYRSHLNSLSWRWITQLQTKTMKTQHIELTASPCYKVNESTVNKNNFKSPSTKHTKTTWRSKAILWLDKAQRTYKSKKHSIGKNSATEFDQNQNVIYGASIFVHSERKYTPHCPRSISVARVHQSTINENNFKNK